MMNEFASNLTLSPDGIWVPRTRHDVSYPPLGNEMCFSVEAESFWFNHRNNVITTVVRAHPPSGAIFDVGGGNGYVSLALQALGFDSIVVEPGSEGARNARQRGLHTVIQSTFEDAGFKPASLPAVGLFDVLEHIEDDGAFLGTLRARLRRDGLLYLTVPAYPRLWSTDDDQAGHFRRYTASSLRKTLESAGWTVRYLSHFFGILPPFVFLLRALPSRLGLRRSEDLERTKREHVRPRGVARIALDRCLAAELRRLEGNRTVPIGSSCIAVAQPRGNSSLPKTGG